MHQTGLFSAHGLSSAPAAQPFLRPSLALPLAAHVVYGILAATGGAATCVGWDAPMRTWWATWGAAGRGSRPCSRSWSHRRCWRCVRTCVAGCKRVLGSRGLAHLSFLPRYRVERLGPPDRATPGPRDTLLEIPFPLLSCSLSVIALRVCYALVQMQEGVRAACEQRGLHPGRTGGLAAIAAVTALRLLVGVGRSRSCLPQRGHAGSCSSLLALRARCL